MTCSPKPITNEFLVGTDFSLICTVSVSCTGMCKHRIDVKALLRLSNALKLVDLSVGKVQQKSCVREEIFITNKYESTKNSSQND